MGVIRIIQIAEKKEDLKMSIDDIMDSVPNKYYPKDFKYDTPIKVVMCTGKFVGGYFFKAHFLKHETYNCDKVLVAVSMDHPTNVDVDSFIEKLLTENIVGNISSSDIEASICITTKSFVFVLKIPPSVIDRILDKTTHMDQQPFMFAGNYTTH